MKRKLSQLIFVFLCMIMIFPIGVSGDTGPKPSVRIQFKNMDDELCYGTLLSKEESTGPARAWDGKEENINLDFVDRDIWEAFVNYEDSDGYYFLQWAWIVSDTKELAWTYYPPNEFKILLYYPESNAFVVSDICKRYAFDTYYTVDMDGVDISSIKYDESLSGNQRLDMHKSYEFKNEVKALGCRMLITVVVEVLIGLLFKFRNKELLYILLINVITQIILNVLLNVYTGYGYYFVYLLLELLVFAIEAIFYCFVFKKKKWHCVLYTLVANVSSFVIGLYLANLLPGLF